MEEGIVVKSLANLTFVCDRFRTRSQHERLSTLLDDMRFEVSPGKSLLQTLLDRGVNVQHGCKQGLCGACKTRVLDGQPDHRDAVLSASNDVMCVCVSGCEGDTLVLDL
jgi:ferredoxin